MNNIKNKIEIVHNNNSSSTEKKLKENKYKARQLSISRDSNKSYPNPKKNERSSNTIQTIIGQLNENYKSNGKHKKIPTHQKVNTLRRQKNDGTDSYKFITHQDPTISNNMPVNNVAVGKLKPVVQQQNMVAVQPTDDPT